jgi:hypothetical protein
MCQIFYTSRDAIAGKPVPMLTHQASSRTSAVVVDASPAALPPRARTSHRCAERENERRPRGRGAGGMARDLGRPIQRSRFDHGTHERTVEESRQAPAIHCHQPLPIDTWSISRFPEKRRRNAQNLLKESPAALHDLPAVRGPPRDREQHRTHRHQHQHLRPQVRQRLVAPEHLRESIDSPGVDGQ